MSLYWTQGINRKHHSRPVTIWEHLAALLHGTGSWYWQSSRYWSCILIGIVWYLAIMWCDPKLVLGVQWLPKAESAVRVTFSLRRSREQRGTQVGGNDSLIFAFLPLFCSFALRFISWSLRRSPWLPQVQYFLFRLGLVGITVYFVASSSGLWWSVQIAF